MTLKRGELVYADLCWRLVITADLDSRFTTPKAGESAP
jgi:hypothetical protein